MDKDVDKYERGNEAYGCSYFFKIAIGWMLGLIVGLLIQGIPYREDGAYPFVFIIYVPGGFIVSIILGIIIKAKVKGDILIKQLIGFVLAGILSCFYWLLLVHLFLNCYITYCG